MRQALHLLIVHASSGLALTAHYGTRWLLPVIECGERVRADPKGVRWTADRGVDCHVVGQWLGRVSARVTDWLVVLSASRAASPADRQLVWTPLERLTSAPALIDYQGWAIGRSLERGAVPSLAGPFGRFDWIDEVKEWIRGVAGEPACRIVQCRSSAHEVVLRARTTCGDLYFKGLTAERGREARLTQALAAIAPAAFATTLALEERADGSVWWLTAGCAGGPAVDAQGVARALADVQRRAMASASVRRELPSLDLEASLRWGVDLVGEAEWANAMHKHVESVMSAGMPRSWIPMDPHPTNMLVDAGGNVRFIDQDDSFFGPAPLAMAALTKWCRDASIYRVYEQSGPPPLADVDWASFEAVAALVDTWLGWQRVERNTDRGDVYGALEIAEARIRRHLTQCVHLR